MKLKDLLDINPDAKTISEIISMFKIDSQRAMEIFSEICNVLSIITQLSQELNKGETIDVYTVNVGYIFDKLDNIDFKNENEVMLVVYFSTVVINSMKLRVFREELANNLEHLAEL
jgi:hypothetical protein